MWNIVSRASSYPYLPTRYDDAAHMLILKPICLKRMWIKLQKLKYIMRHSIITANELNVLKFLRSVEMCRKQKLLSIFAHAVDTDVFLLTIFCNIHMYFVCPLLHTTFWLWYKAQLFFIYIFNTTWWLSTFLFFSLVVCSRVVRSCTGAFIGLCPKLPVGLDLREGPESSHYMYWCILHSGEYIMMVVWNYIFMPD